MFTDTTTRVGIRISDDGRPEYFLTTLTVTDTMGDTQDA
jgi:hypothetical protein